jgi:carbon monoxide dehydrogenase subunit G
MNLDGTFTFKGPRTTVWELLQDPEVLAKALPGTERLVLTSPDHFQGVMKVSVGPVTAAKFDVTVVLLDKVVPEHFTMQIDGKGSVGYTKGTASIALAEAPDATTAMQYTSNVQVGGKIAAVGQRLLESVGKMMMRQALEALERELEKRLKGGEPA